MKNGFKAATIALIALALVAPTAALADRDDKKNKNSKQRYDRRDDDRRRDDRRYVDPRRSSDKRGTSDMRTGRADGEVFRIRRDQGGSGRPPIINRNAPIYNPPRDYRYGDNRYQSPRQEADRRQQTKNEWRNIAIGSGAVALLGLLKNDSRLVFAGAAGTLYAAHRYEQDRKSQNELDRARASYFSRDHFYRDGKRYDRKTVYKGGEKYYQFVCNR